MWQKVQQRTGRNESGGMNKGDCGGKGRGEKNNGTMRCCGSLARSSQEVLFC